MLIIALREDDHAVTFLQPLDGLAVRGNQPGIMIDRNGVRIVMYNFFPFFT